MGGNREQRGSRVRGIPPALVVGRSAGQMSSLCAALPTDSTPYVRMYVPETAASSCLHCLLPLSAAALITGLLLKLLATRLGTSRKTHFLTKHIVMITYVRLLCWSTRAVGIPTGRSTGRSHVSASASTGRSLPGTGKSYLIHIDLRRGGACT